MAKSPKKIRVITNEPVPPEELRKAKNFGKLKTRYDQATKPMYKRSLFQFRQRWFFITLILIIIIILLIMNIL